MVERTVKLSNNSGIHARPATLLSQTASKFQSDVQLEYKGKTINVKSILGVLSLGVPNQAELTIRVNGADEEEALGELVKLFDEGLLH